MSGPFRSRYPTADDGEEGLRKKGQKRVKNCKKKLAATPVHGNILEADET